ncbi:maltose acetyltransferase domain-containing protein [Paenibacillus sp. PvP094]|uniref:maltose acetyltransferase domain-containing protein n=1 Tax=Paenibacillus sp. PvP094 TaxID=3156394 RepID=UPI0033979083
MQPNDPELVADRDVTMKKLYDYNNLHPLERNLRRALLFFALFMMGLPCLIFN